MDVEAKAREIARQAAETRKRPSRGLWIAALVVAGICVVALAIGYFTRGALPPAGSHSADAGSSGFGTGILVGLAAGIAVGGVIAARKR